MPLLHTEGCRNSILFGRRLNVSTTDVVECEAKL